MNDYQRHALGEFERLGWIKDDQYTSDMQAELCEQVVKLLGVFGEIEHSGSSGHYVVQLFTVLSKMGKLE